MTQKSPPTAAPTSMAGRIAHLADWSWSDIKKEWHRLFGSDPPVANRRFIEKRIANRWQEIEFAKTDHGLLERNQRRIDELVATGTLKRQKSGAMPIAGAELIRIYAGVEHRVRVLPGDEFEYAGKWYPSLSMIAREITGTRWSGPAYFGLRKGARR
jgi:Protein of unknown function (DUF2924)